MELIKKYSLPYIFPFRKEMAGILTVLIIFLIFPYVIRRIDITAAAIDPGILSAIILAASAVLIFKAITWWLLKTIWPVFAEYSEAHFENNFRSLLNWQKVVIYLGFYVVVLYAFVVILIGLI